MLSKNREIQSELIVTKSSKMHLSSGPFDKRSTCQASPVNLLKCVIRITEVKFPHLFTNVVAATKNKRK